MTAREHAEELRQEAIRTLLIEKAAVEELLGRLGYQKDAPSPKRRGRLLVTAREETPPPVEEPISRNARPDEASPSPERFFNRCPGRRQPPGRFVPGSRAGESSSSPGRSSGEHRQPVEYH